MTPNETLAPAATRGNDTGDQDAVKEGETTAKIMQDCFLSFGLSMAEANKKIGAIAQHIQTESFKLFRVKDVVYSAEVTGKDMVELHAMIGGRTKQSDEYRRTKLKQTLPGMLSILHQIGTQVVYVSMPKKSASPYDALMKQYGFAKKDIPEEYGAQDMIAYVARLQ